MFASSHGRTAPNRSAGVAAAVTGATAGGTRFTRPGIGYDHDMQPMTTETTQDASPDVRADAPADETRTEAQKEYRGVGIMWSGVAIVALIAVVLIAAIQNTQNVEFDFLWFDASLPLILILGITFGIALVASETVGFVWRHRRRKRHQERDELRRLRSSRT